MEFVAGLWLPILLSGVCVFVGSSVLHMALPIHKDDYGKLPDEDGVLETLRTAGLQPGAYMFPKPASMKAMGEPDVIAKFERGPVGSMVVIPSGPPGMGKNLIQWFLHSLLIGLLAAYLAHHTLEAGAAYLSVFRVTGTAAFLGYAVGALPDSIWKGVKWSITAKFVFDGVVYALVTAGTFAWLWPAAAA